MALNFRIPDEETEKYSEWRDEHNKVCPVREVGAIGGKFTFSFTQTGLGCIHKLKCACGEEADFTDYDNW